MGRQAVALLGFTAYPCTGSGRLLPHEAGAEHPQHVEGVDELDVKRQAYIRNRNVLPRVFAFHLVSQEKPSLCLGVRNEPRVSPLANSSFASGRNWAWA